MKNIESVVVHDWIDAYGGAERVAAALVDLFQPAKFCTLMARRDSEFTRQIAPILETSCLQSVPFAFSLHRYLLELYPRLIESFDLSEFKLILSSSHCVAKGVLVRSDQSHLSYIHTPARYLWDQANEYYRIHNIRGLKRIYVDRVFRKLRSWDLAASNRVDLFVANSENVARRIWRAYRRTSVVVYPFVDLERFKYSEVTTQDYFVILSRLVAQKRVDLAVAACSKGQINLKIIGDGPELSRLRAMAGPSVEFLGRLSDDAMLPVLSGAKGLIFTPEEDFGMVPLEANAMGVPVLAFGRGGALETVIPGVTGHFFDQQDVVSLLGELKRWDSHQFQKERMIEQAKRFSLERFKNEMSFWSHLLLEEKTRRGRFDDAKLPKFMGCETPSISFQEN